jgi:phosphoserine aminotransferase
MKKHNFCSGPSILPQVVFEQAAQAVLNWNDSGLSILEISHRSKGFVDIVDEAVALVKEHLRLTDDYEVIFLSGGATSQFFMTAMNFLDDQETAAYVDTGIWSAKAIKEAEAFGKINNIASSKDKNFSYIPKSYDVPTDAKYLHLTSNNTIYGTQFHQLPETNVPIVADMSSDIFSRPIEVERYGAIYAGAQKNTGTAGATLVIIRKDMLGKVTRKIPTMLDYSKHIAKKSALNTPPVFPIYVSLLNLRWLKEQGGVPAMKTLSEQKAAALYNEIDRNSCFKGNVAIEDRSLMNITFVLSNPDLEGEFLAASDAAGIVAIKGHRLAGGFRASIYNGMPMESVQVLIKMMQDFEKNFG